MLDKIETIFAIAAGELAVTASRSRIQYCAVAGGGAALEELATPIRAESR